MQRFATRKSALPSAHKGNASCNCRYTRSGQDAHGHARYRKHATSGHLNYSLYLAPKRHRLPLGRRRSLIRASSFTCTARARLHKSSLLQGMNNTLMRVYPTPSRVDKLQEKLRSGDGSNDPVPKQPIAGRRGRASSLTDELDTFEPKDVVGTTSQIILDAKPLTGTAVKANSATAATSLRYPPPQPRHA